MTAKKLQRDLLQMHYAVCRQPLCPARLHRASALRLGRAQVLEIAAFGRKLGPRAPFGDRPLLLNSIEVLLCTANSNLWKRPTGPKKTVSSS